MEELVQDLRRDRVERDALLLGQPGRRLRELGLPDLLRPRAQRGDRGHDFERGLPGAEALGLLADELLAAFGLGPAARERLGDDGLEIVDVVEEAAVERADRRVEVTRHRDVDQEQRPPAARRHICGAQHVPVRARRRHDDVDLGEMRRDVGESDRGAVEAIGETAAGLEGAVRDVGDPRAARGEVPGGELADPAGADEHHAPAGEIAEHLRGQGRGGRADRRRALADRGLRAHALADGQRLAEHPVEQRPRRHGLERRAHLAENLPLPRDERVEPGGDPEQMQRGLVVVQPVENAVERLAGLRGEHLGDVLLAVAGQIDLGAIAGREADGIARLARQ